MLEEKEHSEHTADKSRAAVVLAARLLVPLVLGLLSFFVLSRALTAPEFHQQTIAALDDKRTTVMQLTAAATAASAAVTLLPGDTATPIADKLVDLSSCFLLVLCAIYLEKYLVTITGYAACYLLFPLACAALCVNVFAKKQFLNAIAAKLALFGLALVLVIPVSVQVSGLIERTYDASIQATLNTALDTTDAIEDEAAADEEESKGLLSGLVSTVQEGVSGVTDRVQNSLNNFIEALAVMIVTSCVIPILVLLFFFWLIKMALGADLRLPDPRR